MSGLKKYCEIAKNNALTLLGLTGEALEDVITETELHYDHWYIELKKANLPDPLSYFAGFNLMLNQHKLPYPYLDYSTLNGLKISQFLLATAYSRLKYAEDLLSQRKNLEDPGHLTECAALFALDAVRLLDQAKMLIALGRDELLQASEPSEDIEDNDEFGS
jgi:hypothetical protein